MRTAPPTHREWESAWFCQEVVCPTLQAQNGRQQWQLDTVAGGFRPLPLSPLQAWGPGAPGGCPPPLAQSCLGHSRCCCQQLRASVNTQQAQSTEKTSKASQAETKAAVPSFPRLIKDSCPSLYSGANQRRVEPHVSVSPT